MSSQIIVEDLKFILIYVDQLEPCQTFYETYFGFEKTTEFRPGEIYGKVGNVEMWIGSGYETNELGEKGCRPSVMIGVSSVGTLFQQLKDGGQPMLQEAPFEMQPGVYWMQAVDPAGNVLDILGGE